MHLYLPVGEESGLVGWVARNRVHLNLPDVSLDPRWIAIDPEIRSALWAPVQHEKELLGVIEVTSTRANAFSPDDERMLVLFANQVAVAMENARLFAAEQTRSKELETVYDLSRALVGTDDFDEMLRLTARDIVQSCEVTFARALLIEGDEFVVRAAFPIRDLPRTLQIGYRQPAAALAFCQQALKQSEPIFVHATDSKITDAEQEFLFQGVAQSLCLVPLRVGEKHLGLWILGEARREERAPFTPEKLRLLGSITEQVAGALLRSKLNQQTERQLTRLQSLHTIDIAIAGSLDLSSTLSVFLEQVLAQVQVDAGDILLLNSHTGILEYAAGRGFRTRGIERSRLRLGDGSAGRAALEGRTITVSDLQGSGASFGRAELIAGEDFVSYYGFPLFAKGVVKGVFEIFLRTALTPDAEWLEFNEALAGQAAIAVDNAMLVNDLLQSNSELVQSYDTTIEGWSRALDLRDKETEGHTQRVTELAMHLARGMGIAEEELKHVRRGGLLHDIGKMGVPDAILLKPGPLTDEEWVIMRKHPTFAYEMLSPIAYLQLALDIPYCHHEKWDGTGYPRGLKGEQIPLTARIFAIVDVWDALRSDRPYRPAWTADQARENIVAGIGKHFDPEVVMAFLKMVDSGELSAQVLVPKGDA